MIGIFSQPTFDNILVILAFIGAELAGGDRFCLPLPVRVLLDPIPGRGLKKVLYTPTLSPEHVSALCSPSPRNLKEITGTFGGKSQGDNVSALGMSTTWLPTAWSSGFLFFVVSLMWMTVVELIATLWNVAYWQGFHPTRFSVPLLLA